MGGKAFLPPLVGKKNIRDYIYTMPDFAKNPARGNRSFCAINLNRSG